MRLSALLGLPVRTESGESLGHVHDVVADRETMTVRAFAVGTRGLAVRLGFARRGGVRTRPRTAVPWSAVARLEADAVVVRDGTEVRSR